MIELFLWELCGFNFEITLISENTWFECEYSRNFICCKLEKKNSK